MGKGRIRVISLKHISDSRSDTRKSKIENRKWWGIFALVFTFTFGAVVGQPQEAKKVARIGYLSSQDSARESIRSEAIRNALRELGYIEGHNMAIEYRYGDGKTHLYSELAAELVRLRSDVIFANSAVIALAAKNTTRSIPIVFTAKRNQSHLD